MDGDDLLDRWRVRRIAQSFAAGRAALVLARKGRRRPGPASAIHEWNGFHDVLLRTMVYHAIVPRSWMIRASAARTFPRGRFSREAQASASSRGAGPTFLMPMQISEHGILVGLVVFSMV
jgi:hypothetical protein